MRWRRVIVLGWWWGRTGGGQTAMVGDWASGRLVLAGSVSLSGRYAALGRVAADGLRQVVDDVGNAGGVEVGGRALIPVVVLLDDKSTRDGSAPPP